MTRSKRSRGLVILVAAIVAVLFAEAALVTFVFVSPDAKDELGGVAASVQRFWEGSEDDPGIRTKSARAARQAYEDWIVPLWRKPVPPVPDPEFTACVGCHQDYATQRKFNVYMNHPLHAELGLACVTCHPQSPHPNPPRPQESVCADCHDQVNDKDGCSYCHPPASLPHFYAFGAPRQSVVECTVCHPKKTFVSGSPTAKVTGVYDGSDQAECISCHERSACEQCHAQPHAPNWVIDHGDTVLGSEPTECYLCHAGTWCSDRCHAALPPQPIPPIGVRP